MLRVARSAFRFYNRGMIYLDANATTPLLPEVLDAMLPWLREGFHNPSGVYAGAKAARQAVERARGQVAALLGADPEEIVFTSGGTESVNTALHSLDVLCGPGEFLTSAIEHSAVLRTGEPMRRGMWRALVGPSGRLDLAGFAEQLDAAAFASVMWANNETGVIQPVAEACALAKERGLAFHTDAVQAAGKIPLDVRAVPVDMLSVSAHKFHGPKGVGALYIRKGLRFEPLLRGGGQEGGRRSGTENTASIVGMGAAAERARKALESGADAGVRAMRDAFEARVLGKTAGSSVNGDLANRLPNTSHISFERCEAAGLLILLDEAGVACSAGSACMTGKQAPSHVQRAMGIPDERSRGSLRISFSSCNTMEEALAAADLLAAAVEKLRRVQGPGVGPVVVYGKK
jgi:cysteine desulfurase